MHLLFWRLLSALPWHPQDIFNGPASFLQMLCYFASSLFFVGPIFVNEVVLDTHSSPLAGGEVAPALTIFSLNLCFLSKNTLYFLIHTKRQN